MAKETAIEGRRHVIHVTESLGGGVLTVIQMLANQQRESARLVTLVHTERPDTPTVNEVARRFPGVEIIRISRRPKALALLSLWLAVRRVAVSHPAAVIHLHSSYAGLIGRLANNAWASRTVYSPHGFGFLRTDISRLARRFIHIVESHLARRSAILAVGPDEVVFANELGVGLRIGLLRNCIDLNDSRRDFHPHPGKTIPIVLGMGRIVRQKGFDLFCDIAAEFVDRARFVWIGGPISGNETMPRNVEVSGWLPPDEVKRRIVEADVFLLTSRWEGFPMVLLEAQAAGLPAVVLRAPGTSGVVLQERTGFEAAHRADAVAYLKLLLVDEDARVGMAANAWAERARLSSDGYADRADEAYADLLTFAGGDGS